MTALLLESAARATVPLIAGFVMTWMLRSRDAATRHTVWLMALVSAAAMGVAPFAFPAWNLGALPLQGLPGAVLPSGIAEEVNAVASLGLLWLVPMCLLAASLILSVVRVAWWVSGGTELQKTHSVRRLADSLTAPRSVRILVSEAAPVPFAWGLFRPAVILPSGALEWSPADLRSALIHEFGHVRRRDAWSRLVGEALRCVYWFHPLVWLSVTRLDEESEAACDALVLSDGRRRSEYAGQLVALTQQMAHTRAFASLAGSGRMHKRLNRLLDAATTSRTSRAQTRALVAGWTVATIIGTACLQPVMAGEGAFDERRADTDPGVAPTESLQRSEPTSAGVQVSLQPTRASTLDSPAGPANTTARPLDATRTVTTTVTNQQTRTLTRVVTTTVTNQRTRTLTRRINGEGTRQQD